MADTRKLPFINPYINYLTINTGEFKLNEITDTSAYAKEMDINSAQNTEIFTLYASPNDEIQLSTVNGEKKPISRIRLHSFLKPACLIEVTFKNKEKKCSHCAQMKIIIIYVTR